MPNAATDPGIAQRAEPKAAPVYHTGKPVIYCHGKHCVVTIQVSDAKTNFQTDTQVTICTLYKGNANQATAISTWAPVKSFRHHDYKCLTIVLVASDPQQAALMKSRHRGEFDGGPNNILIQTTGPDTSTDPGNPIVVSPVTGFDPCTD
jgi:hypothetical protein